MTDLIIDFVERSRNAHMESVARGEHDDGCEWGPRERNGRTTFFHLCHCSKRAREAGGYTEPPGELIYNPPSCPRCYADATHDGDTWCCRGCKCYWPAEHGVSAVFTDDYGDIAAPAPSEAQVATRR